MTSERTSLDDDTAPPGLRVSGVRKRFGPTEVLRDVSLRATPGTITALVGENGAGKSTLFRILVGLLTADAGRAEIDGRDILGLPLHRKSAAGLGYLPQEGGSFPELTARANLEAVLEVIMGSRREARERAEELLARTGLSGAADRLFSVLSGGEQRRLDIAKALGGRPRVLLLDEPFSGLDPRIVEDIAELLRALASEDVAVLLTDHNVHMTLAFVDHVYLLAGGVIVCEGSPREISRREEARDLYFGQAFEPGKTT